MGTPGPFVSVDGLATIEEESLKILQENTHSGGLSRLHTVEWSGARYYFKKYNATTPHPSPTTLKTLVRLRERNAEAPGAYPVGQVRSGRQFTGVVLPIAPACYFSGIHPRVLSHDDVGGLTSARKLGVLGALLESFLVVHGTGLCVGDVKAQNILTSAQEQPHTKLVYLVDCDSFVPPKGITAVTQAMHPDYDPERDSHSIEASWALDFYCWAVLCERVLTWVWDKEPDRWLDSGLEGLPGVRSSDLDFLRQCKSLGTGELDRNQAQELAHRWASPSPSPSSKPSPQSTVYPAPIRTPVKAPQPPPQPPPPPAPKPPSPRTTIRSVSRPLEWRWLAWMVLMIEA